jgi:hypothetical protein
MNAQVYRPDSSRSTLEFPKTQPTSLHLGTPVVRSATFMVTAHRFGSWSERAHSHHMIWGSLSRLKLYSNLTDVESGSRWTALRYEWREVIRASTDRTLPTRLVGRYADF